MQEQPHGVLLFGGEIGDRDVVDGGPEADHRNGREVTRGSTVEPGTLQQKGEGMVAGPACWAGSFVWGAGGGGGKR